MSITNAEFYGLIGWTAHDDYRFIYGDRGLAETLAIIHEASILWGADQVTIVEVDGHEYDFDAAAFRAAWANS